MHYSTITNILLCGSLAAIAPVSFGQTKSKSQGLKVSEMVSRMSLSEKVGQMIQAEILDLKAEKAAGRIPIRQLKLGSILSGGNSIIPPNTPQSWQEELGQFAAEAASTRLKIPLMIGVDAVHGHGLVQNATVFPHNVGLGAARDSELMFAIGQAVGKEVLATGFDWNFAPAVSVVRDIRWGRSYESFGEDPSLQKILVQAYIKGLQSQGVSATAKHYLGDGGTRWGTGKVAGAGAPQGLDQGDTEGTVADIWALHGQGYLEAIAADVDTVMISYSSIDGIKMHARKDLIEDYLKAPQSLGGLGFQGLVISDWNAIDDIDVGIENDPIKRYQKQIVATVNAGVDMIMVQGKLPLPGGQTDSQYRFERVHQLLSESVQKGTVSPARIDQAVTRILTVKDKRGLFSKAMAKQKAKPATQDFGSTPHRELARQAVRSSLVLLKNQSATLPVTAKKYDSLCVAGAKADDFGAQNGGWTVGWQGHTGNQHKPEGAKTIWGALQASAGAHGVAVEYAAQGKFVSEACRKGDKSLKLVVVGEAPYAEFLGDNNELTLSQEDKSVLHNLKGIPGPTAVLILSGRPLLITEEAKNWDATVAAWLPGSEAQGVADVLWGDYDFRGKLSLTWPKAIEDVRKGDRTQPLFPFGHGLSYGASLL